MSRNSIRQLAFVTTKARFDETLQFWIDAFSAGPFWTLDFSLAGQTFRGQPTAAVGRAALSMYGTTQIEILCALDDEPSPYSEWIERHNGQIPQGGLFHHFLVDAENHQGTLDQLTAHGAKEGYLATMPDGRKLAYLDGTSVTGSYIEVITKSAYGAGIVAAMRDYCDTWDGADPVRDYGEFVAATMGEAPAFVASP
ncbi:MAG: glyoxalase [Microbacteriaceae bacterium]|nr:glyoxalase [Microbacteriaceae bacterium]